MSFKIEGKNLGDWVKGKAGEINAENMKTTAENAVHVKDLTQKEEDEITACGGKVRRIPQVGVGFGPPPEDEIIVELPDDEEYATLIRLKIDGRNIGIDK